MTTPTIPAEVAAVLAELKILVDSDALERVYARLESALTKAVAVGTVRAHFLGLPAISIDWHGEQPKPGTKLYAHAPPAVPVESPASVPDGCRPLDDWYEDIGPVVWWSQDSESDYDAWRGEPAWIGTPLDDDWPGYHTHFTPHPEFPKTATTPEPRT